MDGFFGIAAVEPDRPALVAPSEEVFTYGRLASSANRLSRGLQARGVAPGDTVAVMLPNGVELLELHAAAVQIGVCLVIVNWHLTSGEVGHILEDSGAKVVIIDERYAEAAVPAMAQAGVRPELRFCVGRFGDMTPLSELDRDQSDSPPDDRRSGQIMFYTSGTTGRPKGVRKRFAQVAPDDIGLMTGIGLTRREPFDPDDDSVHIVGGPLYHAAPIAAASMALDSGALLVLMERWTPQRWLELVERYRVTNANMVPTMFHRLLALGDEVLENADVSSLRAVGHAGAPCSIELKQRMLEWLGPIITESYSSTEGAGTTVTAEEWLQRPGTVGRPSPGVTVRILDDGGVECAPNQPGLVFLSQTLWEFEYHHDDAKTQASRRDGMFTVGDIGYLDEEGYLFLCDRQAEVIISGGVNIYPVESEARLLEHPAVADVAVIGIPNDEWGEEVRAVVELSPGAIAGPDLEHELIQWCRDGIAHFKCPRGVDFVASLGRDPNGKVRKGQVRAPYWEGHTRRI